MPRPRLARPVYRLKLRGRVWAVTWTDPDTGRSRAVSTRTEDRQAAAIWRDQWLAGQEQPEPPPQPLVSTVLDGYLAARKGKVEAHDRLEHAAKSLNRHVGNLEPHMLAPDTYAGRRLVEGVSDGTIRREVATLRAALAWAAKQQPPWIERAPYVEMPSRPPPRERWLSRAEMARLIAGADSPHVRLFIILAYHTAARRGAILGLAWSQVDLAGRRIDYRRPGRRETKKRRATVPLNPVVLTALQEARQEAGGRIAERLALAGRNPVADAIGAELARAHVIEFRGRPLQSIRKGFDEACRRAGIEDCTPHTLRHTAATHMVLAGVPLPEVARMLGDTEEMVERVYGKHSPDYLRRAADALAGDLGLRLVSDVSGGSEGA